MRQKQANQMEGGEEEAHACITRVLLFGQKKLFYQKKKTSKTLILIFCLIISNIKVSQLIDITILVGGNHTQPIPHIMLLQILFRQVLQIPANSATRTLRNPNRSLILTFTKQAAYVLLEQVQNY
jgi:hypothetical protein